MSIQFWLQNILQNKKIKRVEILKSMIIKKSNLLIYALGETFC